MASIRSSLPSRLRQLLSSEGAIGPSVKLDSEPPPRIKAFVDKAIQCPLQDIAIPLSGFNWQYGKGNFHHWRPLFLHFDTYFEMYLSCRNDLLLSDDILGDAGTFPTEAILQILRVMQIILENCHNKTSFTGIEHFKLLLASTNPEIVIAALEVLSALVKISSSKLHASGKLVGCGPVNTCLLSLAQGWGSKEEGLGLYSCVTLHETNQEDGLSLFPSEAQNDSDKLQHHLGSSLYFELHGTTFPSIVEARDGAVSSGLSVIHLPGIQLRTEDELSIMKFCIQHYNVPSELRFPLLTRIRYARALQSSRMCRLYSKICLLAFIVLVQSNDSHDELVSFFANEPEFTNELIRIVRSEEIIPGTIRTFAMTALGAQLAAYSASHERARILSGSSISFAGGNRLILLNVLQRAIMSLNNSADLSAIAFVEALLQFYLLHVISSSSTGSVVRGSGMVPTFLPLLEDSYPTHLHLVCLAVKTLQKLMDYSNTAVTLFRDLGGVELLVQRLQIDVDRVIQSARSKDNAMAMGESSTCSNDQLYSQRRLVRALLKALGSATYATANSTRSQSSFDVSLTPILSMIFNNKETFGGEIYSSAVALMSEMIHKDPTCFNVLYDLGLPRDFLSSVVAGILPSSKAITCIPNGLGAICLNSKGLESVKETTALRFLVDIFIDRKYVMAMNEGIVPLANAVEELLRHVSSLRGSGVDLIIEIINKIALLGDAKSPASLGKVEVSDAMDMDSVESADKENLSSCSQVAVPDWSAPSISDEQSMQLCIFHVMVLVHRTMENSETCRLFVEKSGIEALIKLLLRPSITQSSEGMSIALHSTMVFKCFTQHHSTPLAHAICSSLRDQLKQTLTRINAVSGSFLLDPRASPDPGIFSSLSLVEFLLFLAASKDSRWVTALLAEFGNGSKDVLEDIGRIHREALWQIALLEDTKSETEDESTVNLNASQQSEFDMNDSDDPRLNSFRQFLDPLLRRRTSGWSFESQFFDLINLYRDLTRSSTFHQRHVNSPSDLQIESGQEPHQSSSSDLSESNVRKDDSNKRSYRQSCCDMFRSLLIHITHLFQELGKTMLLPARRRDDTFNVSPSSKSVGSTFASIAMDHMNFAGNLNSCGSEVYVSTKCRYFGKVVEFIDDILLDKPDSCNPIILNCLYGHGVIQTVLTTFEATSQLPSAISRTPASPMETDDGRQNEVEEADQLWIYGPSASYGKLMDHLVTSSFILSPYNKHLLTQPLVNGDVQFPRDAETFVKVIQSMVLKAVLPVWTHPRFPECSYEFITTVVSIFRHIFSGVEVKNVGSNVSRVAGPPPNESAISTIVEMGFSRPRAEEALRQVGSNSVELAMEWLFSHSEETQEDDELARALAMSLGSSGTDSKEETTNENSQTIEEELVQLPPVDELLSTCRRLLQMKDTLAFPVRDLLVLICCRNEGQERPRVISFIIEQLKACTDISDNGNQKLLSAFFHVLALVLNEDSEARELASKSCLVKVASDLLLHWSSVDQESSHPKWVTSAFIAIDRLAQVDTKLNADIVELLRKNDMDNHSSVTIDEDKQDKIQMSLGTPSKYLDLQEQKRLIEIACGCIRKQLPSETMHAVLQLCSTLTRTHSVAVSFLEAGGLHLLLSLPASSLFVGFDNVAAVIVRHILEDSHTLQQAMESEIRHSFITSANRQSSGRLTARDFLSNLSSVVQRDPLTFMQAAKCVCQVEMVGERPYIVLTKDRDKDKSKEKDKEKDKTEEKEKQQTNDGKVYIGNTTSVAPATGHGKLPDANSKHSKTHRKLPQSFVSVIDLLLDSVISFIPPPLVDESAVKVGSSSMDIDVDVSVNKDKGKAIVSAGGSNEANNQESFVRMAKVVFLLKLLTEILLMYASSVHILIRKDAEICTYRGIPQRGGATCCIGGIFHHVLYKFLPYAKNVRKERKTEVDWRHKLASKANQFLVASCVRANEARKRIFTEISTVFGDFVNSSSGFRSPRVDIQALIDLLNDVLAARAPTGSYISAEASVTFIEVGLIQSLTQTLRVLDLDHTDSPKIVTGIVKVLESVTKEHVHAFESVNGRERTMKPSDRSQPREGSDGNMQTMDATSNANENLISSSRTETLRSVQNYGGSEAVTEDMEHDQDIDGSFAAAEDDYMQENAEDTQNRESGLDTVSLRFEIGPATQGSLDEDEDEDADEMSGDEGDDVDEDEDDDADDAHNDIEEDDAHHLPHPDTDQDDNEIDEDEFDEEVMEEDEDEEDDEDGVIVRLGEGMNGVDVFDHIEVFGRDSISNDAFHVMPVEIFGSRRQGRTTSIYNLLGRSNDSTVPSQHPLLVEPSSLNPVPSRQPENDRNASNRSSEGSLSQLDSVFRSLRNGRQGHRFNLLANENQLSGGSNSSAIPQGFEELLVSSLRRPFSEKSSNNSSGVESQNKNEVTPSSQFAELPTENQRGVEGSHATPPSSAVLGSAGIADRVPTTNEPIRGTETSIRPPQSVETQYDQADVLRDVEAVSQESGGSGATLGESLRSLDVEIGSADGHDDGGDRQGGGDNRMRRVNPLFSNNPSISGRDASLHSVTEVSEDQVREADQSGPSEEEQHNRDAESIDPAFLDALPEELRAEVLSAQPSEAPPQLQNPEPQNNGDIDPEFLAALPPDIREEVLAQQRAQRMQQSQELEGQPVEMDTVSIIATFPSDIREEVLLTSSDAILANLTPALVAEANMLRERFAQRYNQTLFGIYPRNRRGESSRRGGDGLDRAGGVLSRRSMGIKPIEAEGSPLVDTEGLRALIRLLRVVQPLYKSQQRLLLNLCAHAETRIDLLKILMDLLMLDKRKPLTDLNATEPPYRLYAYQSHVMYSHPQSVGGVPPLVSRRALETLTYLARNHPLVAKLLLEFRLPQVVLKESMADDKRGKSVMIHDESMSDKQEYQEGQASVALLLSLLNQPLYLRSIAHLEQLLSLLDVIIDNAEKKSNSSDDPVASASEQPDAQVSTSGADRIEGSASASGEGPMMMVTSSDTDRQSSLSVLNNLPKSELQLLCSLLAREGLSDNAYTVVGEVLKKLVTIAPIHCHLFINELSGSVKRLTVSATKELSVFGDVEKAILSTATHGAQVLRVLQALSSLVVLVLDKDRKRHILPDMEHSAAISLVWDINAALEPLWQELSNCISKIENFSDVAPDHSSSSVRPSNSMPPLPAGTQNVLPYVESFFVTSEKLYPGQSGPGNEFGINAVSDVDEATGSVSQQKTSGPVMKVEEKHVAFVRFCDKHRKLLNAFVRQNPGVLEKSFSLMLKVPRFIDFDNKRAHFRSKIKHQHDHHHNPLRISVRRAYILEDSYNQLRMRSAQDLKGRLTVHFQGEEGIDAGGLTREWYQLLSRVIFDKGALLFTTVGNESTFQPNPNSVYQTEHLSYFKFVGRVVGKALFDGQLLDVHFTRSFYKHILGVKVTYHDIEAIDPDYFKNLKWMLENDISDVLDLTFSIDADEEKLILYERTQVTDYELIPGGRNIKVTEENKHQYVDLVAEHRLTTAIRPQINAFMEGFNELISRELISIFNDKELELLISGLPDIDLDDLRANTEYSGYSAASPTIQWFWEVVQGFSKEDKARLLQFVTGTSKVPLEGFSALQGISGSQKFQIHKAYGSADHLPSAHTCFNQLDLPEYPSKERQEERLLLAIHEANEGFGFG